MKKRTIFILMALLVLSGTASFAANGEKGASAQALENADDNAVFNRVGDWFATVGKSGAEKEKILAERKMKRKAKRAEKQAQKKAKEMKGSAEKQKKTMEKTMQKGGAQKQTRTMEKTMQKSGAEKQMKTMQKGSPMQKGSR